jgi:SAM-dependent methyltransferase
MCAIDREHVDQMRRDWDARAITNARHYVATGKTEWLDEEFFASGEKTVSGELLTDTINIFQGKDPQEMRILEIGCGAGRVTRALSNLFGEVHAVDVSGEMVERARQALADRKNVFLYQNNGYDLSVLPSVMFDFAYSTIVFQHIPSREIIENYVREVGRVLRPGALFKFQVQGADIPYEEHSAEGSWLGAPFSDAQIVEMAARCGFEPRYRHGAGTQYFWLWFFNQRQKT